MRDYSNSQTVGNSTAPMVAISCPSQKYEARIQYGLTVNTRYIFFGQRAFRPLEELATQYCIMVHPGLLEVKVKGCGPQWC